MTQFRPLYDFVLIRRDKAEDRFGSIIIPDSAKEPMVSGTVLKTGRGIVNHVNGGLHELCVKPGDKVLFGSKYVGQEIELEGEKLALLREDDIALVLETDGGPKLVGGIRPIHDRVIVKRTAAADRTEGGIYIPDVAKDKTYEGEVVAIGTGKILEEGAVRPLDVKVGDEIVFNKFAGAEMKVAGEDRLILREDDILGVLEP